MSQANTRGHAQDSSHNERSVAASSIREVASSMRGNIERGYRRCVNWTRSLPVVRASRTSDKQTAITSLRSCAKNMKSACDKELESATNHLSAALGEKFCNVLMEAESACNSGDSTLDLMPRFLEVVDEYNSVIAAINAIEVPVNRKEVKQSSKDQLSRDVVELKSAFQKLQASTAEREQQLQAENRRMTDQMAEMQRQIAELIKQRSVSARSTLDSRRRRDSDRSDIEVIPHDACRSGHDDNLSMENISMNDA